MLTAIKGYYEQGQIFLTEEAPVSKKTEVIVTFLAEGQELPGKKRMPGALEGRVTIPDNFNDPLEELGDYM